MNILGIWDGHDAGAALLMSGKLVAAINEERFTRRKLEITFPRLAILECLRQGNLQPHQIDQIAGCTFDPAKTLTRLWPQSKERHYRIRRRLILPSTQNRWIKWVKYRLTELKGNALTHWLSSRVLRSQLQAMGFHHPNLILLDHHLCHAASAAFGGGLDQALVVTLDGVGDGLSGSIRLFQAGTLQCLSTIPAKHSLGIFFEHVTNLLHMRELEDEGKVMALADFALPVEERDNPMLDLVQVEGLTVKTRYHANELRRRLADILWCHTPEQFAFMAQRTLEKSVVALIRNGLEATGARHVALAGGVFANVKLNGLIRTLPGVKRCFVFPHMGDGGLAVGAALCANRDPVALSNLYLGPEYSPEEIMHVVQSSGLPHHHCADPVAEAAHLLVRGKIIGWFQGRMEYGPRALGGRSVLALPSLPNIRDQLNTRLKKRSWYQPFCPSMLDGEAARLLMDPVEPPDRFMTSIYRVKPEFQGLMAGVIGRDGTCRPQMVADDNSRFSRLLSLIQEITGYGVLLNTSFNAHGSPMVCSPHDALSAFASMGLDCLILGDWILEKR
ncbi:MAG: hypothetical protein HQL94_07150 [Magnetococcales bacterium]|nr:hypothetical protein [Magnetococcales bacterium]MBF0439095.1 hypothetical protein [Magnetococcales bacterium]